MTEKQTIRFVTGLKVASHRHCGVPLEILLANNRLGPLPYVALGVAIVSLLFSLAAVLFANG